MFRRCLSTAIGLGCLAVVLFGFHSVVQRTNHAAAASPIRPKTIDGALRVAQFRLHSDPKDRAGRTLLSFVLTLDKDNEEALLMISQIDDSIAIKKP